MERIQLQYVLETAKHQNITHAAEALHISQPSLSIQIKNLEQELGVALFERSRKRVYLTEAGIAFVHQAEQILKEINILSETMVEYANKQRGNIRIGLLPIMTHLGLDDLIGDFSKQYPLFNISIMEIGSQALVEQVMSHDLDAAIVVLGSDDLSGDIQSIMLGESALGAIVAKGHPLYEREYLTPEDFTNERFVLSNGNFKMQRLILDELDRRGIPYRVFSNCNQIETCFSLAAKNFGIAFSSAQTAQCYSYPQLRYIPIADIPTRKIYLVYTKNPEYHPALNSFIQFVQKRYSI